MTIARTLRERLRTEMSGEIKTAARRQLAQQGAAALSLRAVARDLGLASSAVYRYFKSRDDLLTALIIEAYEALGQAAEEAESSIDRKDLFGRWSATCTAVRRWALEHPHEYALIYGSPVPGYRAPETTIAPATRVPLLLARIVKDGIEQRMLDALDLPPVDERSGAAVAFVSRSLFAGGPERLVLHGLMAWIEIFGAVSFELFGHLHNVVADYDAFFDSVVQTMARFVGVRSPD